MARWWRETPIPADSLRFILVEVEGEKNSRWCEFAENRCKISVLKGIHEKHGSVVFGEMDTPKESGTTWAVGERGLENLHKHCRSSFVAANALMSRIVLPVRGAEPCGAGKSL